MGPHQGYAGEVHIPKNKTSGIIRRIRSWHRSIDEEKHDEPLARTLSKGTRSHFRRRVRDTRTRD